ncbi:hypothetical protein [Butyricicoccus pullicaecorum]|uniref:hypothetical protein n=1 Tax=Butyricicoccus pullicaecorum TaxID=501571 RepID=UPI003990550C
MCNIEKKSVSEIFVEAENDLEVLKKNLEIIKEDRKRKEKRRNIIRKTTKLLLSMIIIVTMGYSLMIRDFNIGFLSSTMLMLLWLP